MKLHHASILGAALLAACNSDTGRNRVDFDVEAQGVRGDAVIITERGWNVTLTTAKLHVGPLYFFEGDPLFARAKTPSILELARALVTIPEAHAHPGHYVEGEALADLLTSSTIDLLGPKVVLGHANGVSGAYNSARVELAGSPDLGGHTAEMAGTAVKDGTTIEFHAVLDLEKSIAGIAFGAEIAAGNGRVHLDVDLAEWVNRVEFAAITPTPGAVVELEAGSQGHNAFTRGVENTTAFHFSWVD